MNYYNYSGFFADIKLCYSFRHPNTASYFGIFLNKEEDLENPIVVNQREFDYWSKHYQMDDNGYTEFSISVYYTSDNLLKDNSFIIHAGAMLWGEKAYLFAADSGTGKSTQLSLWNRLYPTETKIINGDKPIIKCEQDRFMVYPSPWKGKEGWGDDSLSAPLGGIILLQQGQENSIEKKRPNHISPRLLTHCFSTFEIEDNLHKLCRIMDQILESIPVWLLVNKGDEDSVRLTRNTLLEGR